MNGKMLMFSKVSVKIFVYNLIDVFMFPNEDTAKIYNKYKIQKCFIYQNLTDTDNTSVFFVFICNLPCSVSEKNSREILFKVLIKSKILERLDVSDDFWEQFGVQNKVIKNKLVFLI